MSCIWAKGNKTSLGEHIQHLLKTFEKIKDRIPKDLREAVKYAILLHDLGKVLPYFQIVSLKNEDYKPFNIDRQMNIYHSLASALFINKEELEKIEGIGKDGVDLVLSAVAYHHWKKSLEEDMLYGKEKFKRLFEYAEKDKLIENLRDNLKGLLEEKIIDFNEAIGKGLANGLCFADYVIPPYRLDFLPKRVNIDEDRLRSWILISGFLQRCDHYASFCEEGEEESLEECLEKVEIENLDYGSILSNVKKEINKKDKEKGGRLDSIWQEEVVEKGKDKNLILVAPTGSGKTEFAFLWSNGGKLIYTLPIRSAVEQTFGRARRVFEEERVGILHGDADVYMLREIKEKNEDIEKMKIYQLSKNLSYPVIVATGDQFFPYALRPPLYERVYATLSYSRLVIDEVQAYDPVACAIVVKFIEDVVRLGGRFLLMTATLPKHVEDRINDIKENGNIDIEKIDLYYENREKYENLKKHKLKVRLIEESNSISHEYIEEILAKASEGNRVLVILNTVRQAEKVYESIIERRKGGYNIKEDNIILFHSRFTYNEKQSIKDKIENLFKNPKENSHEEGKILVATQVVEASIDIDADILYTEICPLDALVQRMGRVLRRYKETYLYQGDDANVHIFVFEKDYKSGKGKVYNRELIEKSLKLLSFHAEYLKNQRGKTYEEYLDDKVKSLKKNQQEDDGNKNKGKGKKQKKSKGLEDMKELLKTLEGQTLLLSELDKYTLVSKFYESLSEDGEYLQEFIKTLSILDAGYMSDRREEAQDIFRRIANVSVVDGEREKEFKEKVKELVNDKLSYTAFKDKIIAEFVVQIPYYKLKGYKPLSEWIREVEADMGRSVKDINREWFEKLKKWCSDIFVIYTKDENKYIE